MVPLAASDQVSGFLSDGEHGRVRVRVGDQGDDRGVGHSQAGHPAPAAARPLRPGGSNCPRRGGYSRAGLHPWSPHFGLPASFDNSVLSVRRTQPDVTICEGDDTRGVTEGLGRAIVSCGHDPFSGSSVFRQRRPGTRGVWRGLHQALGCRPDP